MADHPVTISTAKKISKDKKVRRKKLTSGAVVGSSHREAMNKRFKKR